MIQWSEEDSLPKGIGDQKQNIDRVVNFIFLSEEDSLPKGIGDQVVVASFPSFSFESEEDSLPKGSRGFDSLCNVGQCRVRATKLNLLHERVQTVHVIDVTLADIRV